MNYSGKFHKRMIMRGIFAGEVIVFAWFYCFGAQGMYAVRMLKKDNEKLEQHIADVQNSVVKLERDVYAWQENSFLKEKLAREQLQMARDGEEVYLVN